MYMQDYAMHEFRGVQGNLQGQEDLRGVLKITVINHLLFRALTSLPG